MRTTANLKFVYDRREFSTTDRVGISLHCHTQHSREVLDFVPYYASQFPIVSWLFEQQSRTFERANGKAPNFNLGHWEPPLTGIQLFDSESESLHSLSLSSIISITDHDSISANLEVNESIDNDLAPISLEWTVPFGEAYFHIGVHNLPPSHARMLSDMLVRFSSAGNGADTRSLRDLLHLLNEIPEVLVVLNHPFWDIEMIGQDAHDFNLLSFVAEFGSYIHALELNGFRGWSENKQTIQLAEDMSLPLISGGDRHCLTANAMINTSRCSSFAEFVDEIRDGHSNIVILPEYRKPLLHRQVRSISQILGTYPNFADDRRHWSQRVYFDAEDGNGATPLSERWGGKVPRSYKLALWMFRQLASPRMMTVFERVCESDTYALSEMKLSPASVELLPNEWRTRFENI